MTLSARTSTLGGIVRLICLAAFRLMDELKLLRLLYGEDQPAFFLSRSCRPGPLHAAGLSTGVQSIGHEALQPQHELDGCTPQGGYVFRQARLFVVVCGLKGPRSFNPLNKSICSLFFCWPRKRSRIQQGRSLQVIEVASAWIEPPVESPLCSCASPRPGMREGATREVLGMISVISSSRLPLNPSGERLDIPVILPPGRGKAGNKPLRRLGRLPPT